MANISINWETYVITIPQSYLTLVSGTLYELDTNQFRLDLKALEASDAGIGHPKTHNHNTTVTVAGVTFARTLTILSPYSITFEEGMYSVRLTGSNNNIFDVQNGILNQNYVQVISTNSAGMITVSSGSGLSEDEHDTLMSVASQSSLESVASEVGSISEDLGSVDSKIGTVDGKIDDIIDVTVSSQDLLDAIGKINQGNWKILGNQMIMYAEDGIEEVCKFNLYDKDGNLTTDMSKVTERRRVL